MKIQMMKPSDLIEYENNPRNNDDAVDAVANSIKAFGFKVPIVITKENVIIAGHTRLKAAIKLGLNEVPCIIADDLTDEQIKAFRLADNKTAELATWDLEKLEQELFEIDMDMLQFGFEDLESDNNTIEDDEYDFDDVPEVPSSQKGDIYILGKHKLMCGDSTKVDDVNKLIDGEIMDMVFTDPPYNVDYEGTAGKIMNDKMEDDEFYQFLFAAYVNMFNNIKKGGVIYVCHASTEIINFALAYVKSGFKMAQYIIWDKGSGVPGRQDFNWQHEPMLYGWKEGAAHYYIKDYTQTTIWKYPKARLNDLHPTMKPLELVGRAIKNSSKPNEKILDLFGGSGSTLIASEQLSRIAYMMELDEKFVDVIVKRYLSLNDIQIESCYRVREGIKIPLNEIPEFNLDSNELL